MLLLPIGGLGEIGRNCLLVEQGPDALIVDCGVQFPGPEVHGADLILPDFRPLRARKHKLRAILVTHGHEDHLGAVPYLLRELRLPVYASPLTLRLLRHKLDELEMDAELHPLIPRTPVQIGGFRVEPLRVTHSIPDSLAFAIQTDGGTLFHSGDFKIDQLPVDGEVTDLARFAELGERGIACLLSDSTNAGRDGKCPGELTVAPALRDILFAAPGRVVVAMFASNLHRMQQVLGICAEVGRRVALNGRSLQQNVELATELHRLKVPPGILVNHDTARGLKPRELCILSTGAQGEPRSGLSRLARGEHGSLFLEAGDQVVFSASLIPGNELTVHAVVNQFARQHIECFQESDRLVHVSGHGYREDQRLLLRLLKPKAFIAVHGEPRHLAHHRVLALECGVPADRVLEVYDGDWVEVSDNGARITGHEEVELSYLDRNAGGSDVDPDVIRDRRILADSGLVTAIVQLDRTTGALITTQIIARGFSAADQRRYTPVALDALTLDLEAMPTALKQDGPAVEELVTKTLRRIAKRELQRRPIVLPIVLRR